MLCLLIGGKFSIRTRCPFTVIVDYTKFYIIHNTTIIHLNVVIVENSLQLLGNALRNYLANLLRDTSARIFNQPFSSFNPYGE